MHTAPGPICSIAHKYMLSYKGEKMSQIYSNQKEAGDKILNYFNQNNQMVKLYAQMQSGKTGTYFYVIDTLRKIKFPNIQINKAIVLLADSNSAVKDQIKKDMGFPGSTSEEWSKIDTFGGIYVFHRTTKDIEKIKQLELSNTLFILDECHVAERDGNLIAPLIPEILKDKTNKYLTVSATDYAGEYEAELCGVVPRVTLVPGEGYYSIQRMLELNRVRQSFPIFDKKNMSIHFINLLRDISSVSKYAIIRVHSEAQSLSLQSSILKTFGKTFEVDTVNSKTNSDKMGGEFLEIAPKKPHIIIVNGGLRLGKQIVTKNISIGFDTPGSDTDTAAQSLGGRFCGYGKENDGVILYGNLGQLENYAKSIQDGSFKIPEQVKTKNLRKSMESEIIYRCRVVSEDFANKFLFDFRKKGKANHQAAFARYDKKQGKEVGSFNEVFSQKPEGFELDFSDFGKGESLNDYLEGNSIIMYAWKGKKRTPVLISKKSEIKETVKINKINKTHHRDAIFLVKRG